MLCITVTCLALTLLHELLHCNACNRARSRQTRANGHDDRSRHLFGRSLAVSFSAQIEARLTAKACRVVSIDAPHATRPLSQRQHDALESARPGRACLRPAAELDRRQDRAQRLPRAGQVQDRDDEPRLQHTPTGSALEHGWGRNDCSRPSTPKRFRCIPVQHNRNDLLKGPRRRVAGPSEFEYQVEAVARPILRNPLRSRSQRIRDGSYVLVLPTDQHDAFDR
jgi:hypothetical protein